MHADEIAALELISPDGQAPAAPRPVAPPTVTQATGAYSPYAFATWALARKAYPGVALRLVVDPNGRQHWVERVMPREDLSDLEQDGTVHVLSRDIESGYSDAEIQAAIKSAGDFVPPFQRQ